MREIRSPAPWYQLTATRAVAHLSPGRRSWGRYFVGRVAAMPTRVLQLWWLGWIEHTRTSDFAVCTWRLSPARNPDSIEASWKQ